MRDNSTYTVNLPIAFKNAFWGAIASLSDLINGSNNVFTIAVKPSDLASLCIKTEFSNDTVYFMAYWVSIGN